MRQWENAVTGETVAAFHSDADADLFARAAKNLYGWNFIPSAEATELPFPVFYERRQIFFPVASFLTQEAQTLAATLFAQFDQNARYSTEQGLGRYAPLQMATRSFLDGYAECPELPQPYDVAARFIEDAIESRPLNDDATEMETFFATTDLVIQRRELPRWKDIFHLLCKRAEAAQEYASRQHAEITDAMLDSFLESYQKSKKAAATSMEEAPSVAPDPTERSASSCQRLRRTRKVLVDADACPVIPSIEKISERYGIPVVLCCDDSRDMVSSYSDIVRVPHGNHAADMAIIALCHKGDIIVTEDSGLALLALAKEAYPIASDGWRYTMRMMRQGDGKLFSRRALKRHLHKRVESDDEAFERGFLSLLHKKYLCDDE